MNTNTPQTDELFARINSIVYTSHHLHDEDVAKALRLAKELCMKLESRKESTKPEPPTTK